MLMKVMDVADPRIPHEQSARARLRCSRPSKGESTRGHLPIVIDSFGRLHARYASAWYLPDIPKNRNPDRSIFRQPGIPNIMPASSAGCSESGFHMTFVGEPCPNNRASPLKSGTSYGSCGGLRYSMACPVSGDFTVCGLHRRDGM